MINTQEAAAGFLAGNVLLVTSLSCPWRSGLYWILMVVSFALGAFAFKRTKVIPWRAQLTPVLIEHFRQANMSLEEFV